MLMSRGNPISRVSEESEVLDAALKEAGVFPSQEALDKYLKSHPKSNPEKHKVVERKKDKGGKEDLKKKIEKKKKTMESPSGSDHSETVNFIKNLSKKDSPLADYFNPKEGDSAGFAMHKKRERKNLKDISKSLSTALQSGKSREITKSIQAANDYLNDLTETIKEYSPIKNDAQETKTLQDIYKTQDSLNSILQEYTEKSLPGPKLPKMKSPKQQAEDAELFNLLNRTPERAG